jgi:hypothetical protein
MIHPAALRAAFGRAWLDHIAAAVIFLGAGCAAWTTSVIVNAAMDWMIQW